MNGHEMNEKVTPHIVTTGYDEAGAPVFITDQRFVKSHSNDMGGVVWLWETSGMPSIPGNIGTFPTGAQFPKPGDSKFGICWLAPESMGKMDYSKGNIEFAPGERPGFHSTNSLDYAIILSGGVELDLPGGQVATLKKGSCWVQTGAPHGWRVVGDEPCVFALFIIGATREG